MYEMVGYKLCLRFFTIQISEAKKQKVLYKQQEYIFHSSEAGKSKIKVVVDSAPQWGHSSRLADGQLSALYSQGRQRGGEESFLMSFLMGTSYIRREHHPHDLF